VQTVHKLVFSGITMTQDIESRYLIHHPLPTKKRSDKIWLTQWTREWEVNVCSWDERSRLRHRRSNQVPSDWADGWIKGNIIWKQRKTIYKLARRRHELRCSRYLSVTQNRKAMTTIVSEIVIMTTFETAKNRMEREMQHYSSIGFVLLGL